MSDIGWRNVKIGALGIVVTGKTPPSARPELFGDAYPFITPSDIDGVSRTVATDRFIAEEGASAFRSQMIPAGAVCFVCIGATIGKMCIATSRSMTNQQVNSIIVDEALHDPKFVFYALRQIATDVKSLAGGAATPIISKSSFSDISIRVAPLPVQRRIASILSSYDDLIENNTRRIAILEEMARRNYEEWFVRFRFPGYEGVRMVESEMGLVPEGWVVAPLSRVVTLQSGFAFKSSIFAEDGEFGLVTIKNVQDGEFIESCSSRLSSPPENMPLHCTLKVADILLSLTGNVGRCCFVTIDGCLLNQRVAKIQPVKQFDWAYSYLMFRSNQLRARLEAIANGVAQQNLSPVETQRMLVLVPPEQQRQRFAGVATELLHLTLTLRRSNSNLRTTRDLLLPKLISGELDVSELPEPEAVAA